jgi:hypothetical protein
MLSRAIVLFASLRCTSILALIIAPFIVKDIGVCPGMETKKLATVGL